MNTEEKINERSQTINSIIERFLPEEKGPAKTVIEAMNYSIHAGGKRLRPMLMMESYELFGGKEKEKVLYPFMAAIEMIHTYSLCHDDLPAMDNDDMRRGKPSTHAQFGEAMGILAGDGLLNYAFEVAFKAFDEEEDDTKSDPRRLRSVSRALRILADKAGIYGMIAGQVVDIESENDPSSVTMDTVKFIHEKKTAAMIESSLMIGAALAGAGERDIKIMEEIGSDVGLAFQIRDDILDVTGDENTLGKPVGSDAENGKATYVTLTGLKKAEEDVAIISENALSKLSAICGDSTFLAELIRYLIDRNS